MLIMLTVCFLVQETIKGHRAAPPSAHPAPNRNRLAVAISTAPHLSQGRQNIHLSLWRIFVPDETVAGYF